jgi:hypothetical protein
MTTATEVVKIGEPSAGGWVALAAARTQVDRLAAVKRALQLVKIPEADLPIPRLMLDLPWSLDNDAVIDSILERLIMDEDLVHATNESEVLKAEDLLSFRVKINDVRAVKSDVSDARWGAYLMLDVDTPTGKHLPVSIGAAEVVVTVWRAYCEGRFPVTGMFVKLGNPTPGRNQPIGFRVFDEPKAAS